MVWSAGATLTAAQMNTYLPQEFSTYTPSWTASTSNPSIGNGSISGRYIAFGDFIRFRIRIVAGSTTTFGSGNYSLSLPVPLLSGEVLQASIQYIDGGSLFYHGAPFLESGSTFRLGVVSNSVANIQSAMPTVPFTFANTDEIRVAGTYERS